MKFEENLDKMMFLQLKRDRISKLFNIDISGEVYFPLNGEKLTGLIKDGRGDNIPLVNFVEGMFYVLGADKDFKYNEVYKKILGSHKLYLDTIKALTLEQIKDKKYTDGYILLKGLLEIEKVEDNYDKFFLLANEIRKIYPEYKEDILEIIDRGYKIEGYKSPFLYDALIKYDEKDFENALSLINNYENLGGKLTKEVAQMKENLKNIKSYERGKELIMDEPKLALEYLLPLVPMFDNDAVLLYHIGVAYRNLNQNGTAIEYLEKSLSIDDQLIEVVNELGINYAAIEDYNSAITLLRKAFEATKAIEICTNLVMCYLNKGDMKNAKTHLEIAEKISKDDEIVRKLKEIL